MTAPILVVTCCTNFFRFRSTILEATVLIGFCQIKEKRLIFGRYTLPLLNIQFPYISESQQ